jgi:hypothetical protein
MLIKAKTLKRYHLNCLDGDVGKVKEFYFDDHFWTIRYLVIETGYIFAHKEVFVSPKAIDDILNDDAQLILNLSRDKIETGPSIDSDKPVSRQFEEAHHQYYGIPKYWAGEFAWAFAANSSLGVEATHEEKFKESFNPHLRSSFEVRGYHLHANDGDIGHIDDFVFDDQTWTIRYLIVDTKNWWPGKKILISPIWIDKINWRESKIYVNLSRETMKSSPEYKSELALTRRYETGLHRHYNRKGYWDDASNDKKLNRVPDRDTDLL